MTQVEMAKMTSKEFSMRQSDLKLAIIPVGATEQHGANLALSTDYAIAHHLSVRLAERLTPAAVVTPAVPFGLSQHHTGFPGTITLGAQTMISVLMDIARSLKDNGVKHILFMNGHNGNSAILNVASTQIRYDLGMHTATAFWFQQAADKVRQHARTQRYGHACEIETSVLLELDASLVAQDQLEEADMLPSDLKYAFNNEPYFLHVPIPFNEQTRNGVFGDARLSSIEIGKDLVETALDRMEDFSKRFVAVI